MLFFLKRLKFVSLLLAVAIVSAVSSGCILDDIYESALYPFNISIDISGLQASKIAKIVRVVYTVQDVTPTSVTGLKNVSKQPLQYEVSLSSFDSKYFFKQLRNLKYYMSLSDEREFYPIDVLVNVLLLDKEDNVIGHAKPKPLHMFPDSKKAENVEFVFASPVVSSNGNCKAAPAVASMSLGSVEKSDSSVLVPTDTMGTFLMIFNDVSKNTKGLYSVVFNELTGFLAKPTRIVDTLNTFKAALPSAVKVNSGYVVAWQETPASGAKGTLVKLQHLNQQGIAVGNPVTIQTDSIESRPILVNAYGKLALAWMDGIRRLSDGERSADQAVANLALLDPVSLAIVNGPVQFFGDFPTLAFNGSVLEATWVDRLGKKVSSGSFNSSLNFLSNQQIYSSKAIAQQPRMTAVGSSFFSVWEDLAGDEYQYDLEWIRGAYVSSTQALGATGIVQETGTGSANWPVPASSGIDGAAVVVAYYQFRDFGSQIYITRFSKDGERIDGEDYPMTDIDGLTQYPHLVYSGTDDKGEHYGLSWTDDHTGVNQIYFRAFSCK